jgi:hypothetical protein
VSDPEWTDEVRQDKWSLEMIFRWLEESAAFLYEIEAHRHRRHKSDRESSAGAAWWTSSGDPDR